MNKIFIKYNISDTTSKKDTFIVPDFLYKEGYKHFQKKVDDTIYEYKFTDNITQKQDYVLNEIRTINDSNYFNNVRYISLHKTYFDHAHPFKDADGTYKPLPISKIICRYDKIAKDKWFYVNYETHEQTEFKVYNNEIVRTDSFVTSLGIKEIYFYYKAIPSF